MTGTKWTEKQIKFLLKNYGKMPMDKLSKKLKKSTKACSIKFWRTKDFSDYICATECAKILHIDVKMITEHFTKHDLPYIRVKREFLINFDDFVDWLKDHQNLWDSKKLEHLALGYEYDWLKEKRKKDAAIPYLRTRWSDYEIATLCRMINMGMSYEAVSTALGGTRSAGSCRHKWKRLYRKEA